MKIANVINKKVGVKLLFWITIVLILGFQLIGYITYNRERATLITNLNTKINLQSANITELTILYLQNKKDIYNTLYTQFTDKLKQKVNVQYNIVLINYIKYKNWLKQHPDQTNEVKQQVLKKYQNDQLEQISDLNNQDKQHYVFILQSNGIVRCHIEKSLINKNIINVKDSQGIYIIKGMIDLQTNRGSGLYSYQWQNENEKPHLKTSFVKYFKDWDWVLGTGEYETDVQQGINSKLKDLFNNYAQQVNKVKISEDSYPVVLQNKDGKFYFYVYVKPSLMGKPVPDYGQKGNPLQKGIQGEQGILHYYWQVGTSVYQKTLWYKHIPNSNIYITYAVYDKDIYAPLHTALIDTIILFIGILVATMGILMLIVEFNITKILKPLPTFFAEFQQGDLTKKLNIKHNDEIGKVIEAINNAIDGLALTIVQLINRRNQLATSNSTINDQMDTTETIAGEINANVNEVSSDMENMSSNVEEVNASVEEFQTTINNLASMVQIIDTNQDKIGKQLKENDIIQNTTKEQIEELIKDSNVTKTTVENMNEKIQEITEFSNLIQKIAEQTNLLSLNAAIEAQRQGEAGSGFQVIADEIRQLANDSKETQEKISESINEIVSISDETVKTVDATITNIKSAGDNVNKFIQSSETIQQQIEEIIAKISDVSQNVEESNQTIEEISTQVNNVQELVVSANSKIDKVNTLTNEQVKSVDNLIEVKKSLDDIINGINTIIDFFHIKEQDIKAMQETLKQVKK